ncbi:MAG: dihydrolipoyl dehydrogenase [Candidatus Latescibacterota bacterium]
MLDLVVIGAGPGGYSAAARAGKLGMKVACVEREYLGGTCLNVGCIPSKALLESSYLYARARQGLEHHGIRLGEVGLDLAPMMARKDKIVRAMAQGVASLLRGSAVERVEGEGRIAAPRRVQVRGPGGESVLETERILIATGSLPVELRGLPFDGERVISSTEALRLTEVPARLVVVGAGAIGLEMASLWSRLGAQVLVVEYMEQVLPGCDAEMATQLLRLLKRQGMRLQLGASASRVEVGQAGVRLTVTCGDQESVEECERVLVAVGRRPCSEGLGLEEVGVARDERGRIRVGADFQTSVPGIYAIGDCIPGPMLAHKAEEEGKAAVERMAGRGGHVNYEAIPLVVYTHPELASVGQSEASAQEKHGAVRVGRRLFRANGRAHCMDEIDGLVKVVSHPRTDRLLGVHVLGAQASHLIAEAVLAMEFSASAEDLARTVHAHPALSEVVRDAACEAQE